jgi:hypothetical protein
MCKAVGVMLYLSAVVSLLIVPNENTRALRYDARRGGPSWRIR